MDTVNYINNLMLLAEEINENVLVSSPYSLVFEGLSNQELIDFQEKNEVILDSGIKDFFSQCNYVEIEWELKKNYSAYDVSGKIFFPELDSIFNGFEGSGWKDVLYLQSGELINNKYFPFDLGISEEIVCFKLENKIVKNNLYLVSIYEDKVIDLNMDIEKYIGLTLRTKGFEFWQRSIIYPESNEGKRLKKYLPVIFKETAFPLIFT